jgi:hypothetical protein
LRRSNKGETEDVKAPSAGAKSLCIPFDQKRFGEFPEGENQKCIQCGAKAKSWTLFGRSESRRGRLLRRVIVADADVLARLLVGWVGRSDPFRVVLACSCWGLDVYSMHSFLQLLLMPVSTWDSHTLPDRTYRPAGRG